MRQTRSKTRQRRNHQALEVPQTIICLHCNEPKLPHRVCLNCGRYKEREVMDVYQKIARAQKRKQAKQEARGKSQSSSV